MINWEMSPSDADDIKHGQWCLFKCFINNINIENIDKNKK